MEKYYINSWKTENSIDFLNNISLKNDYIYNLSYLNKHTKDENVRELENYIYNTIVFYFNNKQQNFDENKYIIEYSIYNHSKSLNIEYNKATKSYPILSILCNIGDKSDTDYFIFTDVNLENYKYKDVSDENNFIVYIPEKNSNLVYNGSTYNGLIKNVNSKNIYIKINIWESKIENTNIMHNNRDSSYIEFIENSNNTYEYVIRENIMEKLLYEDTEILTNKIKNFILKNCSGIEEKGIIINIKNKNNLLNGYEIIQEAYGDMAEDIYPFINTNINIINNNRFNRNKLIKNTLSKDVCFWIIDESEKRKYQDSPFKNYSTYLNVEYLPGVLNFVLYVSNIWFYEIKNRYSINCELHLNIKNVFICKDFKYNDDLSKNIDNNFLTINIQLNESSDYTGGEIEFEDNDKVNLQQGDMLIYNGRKLRSKGKVESGCKVVLVMMIELV
jgi:hypothetical protein